MYIRQACAAPPLRTTAVWLECYYGAAQPCAPAAAAGCAGIANIIDPLPLPLLLRANKRLNAFPQKEGPLGRTMDFLAGAASWYPTRHQILRTGSQGGFTVILANGQVWKQSDDQRDW